MEITLIAVTLLSLFVAISLGVVVWRLFREERRRSAARLAALAAELRRGGGAAGDEGPGAGFEPLPPPREGSSAHPEPGHAGAGGERRRRGPAAHPEPGPFALEPAPDSGAARIHELTDRRSYAFVPEPAPDSGAAAAPVPGGGLFSPPIESTSTGRGRLAALAGGAGVVLAAVTALFLLSDSDAGDAAAPDGGRPPLDLIALDHAAEGPFLDIRGAVRNPPRAPGAERLSVVATAFDAAGRLVATRRAPVETPSLPPGADSPFTVRLLAAGVSRYRISFLLDDAAVPHVDRRPAGRPPAFPGDSS